EHHAGLRGGGPVPVVEGVGDVAAGVGLRGAGAAHVEAREGGSHAVDVEHALVAARRAAGRDEQDLDLVAHVEGGAAGGDVDELPVGVDVRGAPGRDRSPGDAGLVAEVEGRVEDGVRLRHVGELDEEVGLLAGGVGRVLEHGGEHEADVHPAVGG